MDQDEAETDRKTCEVACSHLAVSGSEDHKDKEEGGYDLNKESTSDTTGSGDTIATKRILSYSHYSKLPRESDAGPPFP